MIYKLESCLLFSLH